jgi:NTE family protein
MTTRALVLGSGSVAGIAWMTGLLAGLAESGVDVLAADLVLGTSAGATVAAQVTSGLELTELLDRQTDPALQTREQYPAYVKASSIAATRARMYREVADPLERRRQIGSLALGARTVPEPERRSVVAARLPAHDWPARPLQIVIVDADTGQHRVVDRSSGISLVDAVTASCAIPMVWPPVTLGGARYIDGGVRSFTNVDLAGGYDEVLIIAPMIDPPLAEQVAAVRKTARTGMLGPDEAARSAMGPDPLDPSVRGPSARAGYRQGLLAATSVARTWSAEHARSHANGRPHY